jgi:hypothetical protein
MNAPTYRKRKAEGRGPSRADGIKSAQMEDH